MTTEAAAAQISVGDLRVENDSLQCLLINLLGVSLWVLSGVVVVVLEARRWPQERQEQQRRAQSSGDGGGGLAVFRRLDSLLTLSAPGLALTLFSLSALLPLPPHKLHGQDIQEGPALRRLTGPRQIGGRVTSHGTAGLGTPQARQAGGQMLGSNQPTSACWSVCKGLLELLALDRALLPCSGMPPQRAASVSPAATPLRYALATCRASL